MTKKDFELIADLLWSAKPARGPGLPEDWFTAQMDQWAWTVATAAARLRSTNPRFDADRFRAACGLNHEPRGV